MPTNGDCTIIRKDDDDNYFIVATYPCMWQETEAYEVKKYEEENAYKAAVWIPDISADVKKRDYIIRGKLEDISEFDPDTALTVMSTGRRDYGSPDMWHVQIGAR